MPWSCFWSSEQRRGMSELICLLSASNIAVRALAFAVSLALGPAMPMTAPAMY